MRNRLLVSFSMGLVGLVTLYSWAEKKPAEKPADKPAWRRTMTEFSSVLGRLVPSILSEKKFYDPANAQKIEADTRALLKLSHALKEANPPEFAADPTLSVIANVFPNEVSRALQELKRDNREYARSQLKTVIGFCIACHTRRAGNSSVGVEVDLKVFTPMEQAEFYLASRQFEKAIEGFKQVIVNPKSSPDRKIEWSKAIRYALAIAIRVKKSPELAKDIVRWSEVSSSVPVFMKHNADAWSQSVEEWKKEKALPQNASEEAMYQEVLRLLAKAKSKQEYALDRSGDVDYLRATAAIHDLLNHYPEGKHSAEGLLLAGISYEVLRDLNLWTFHEIYFEACIRKVPHSDTAMNCYRRLEQSTYAGYSGSAGVFVPVEVKTKLTELEGVARLEPKSPK